MEGYVGKLREATGTAGRVLEVGDQFPSLRLKAEDGGGTIDYVDIENALIVYDAGGGRTGGDDETPPR